MKQYENHTPMAKSEVESVNVVNVVAAAPRPQLLTTADKMGCFGCFGSAQSTTVSQSAGAAQTAKSDGIAKAEDVVILDAKTPDQVCLGLLNR